MKRHGQHGPVGSRGRGSSGYPSVPQGKDISLESQMADLSLTPSVDHVYFDISINNTSATGSMLAQYSANLTQPILDNPQDYYVAPARIEVPTYTIPLFDFVTNAYSVCLTYNSVDYFQYVPFIDYGTFPNPSQGVFGYQVFIDMVNSALATAWTALITANMSAPGASGDPPRLLLDPTTDIISLIAQQNAFTPDNAMGTTIYMNQALFRLFNSLPNGFNGYNAPNGKVFSITVKNDYNNFYPIGPTGSNGSTGAYPLANSWQISQEASTLGSWSEFQALAITTANIPIQVEYLPQASVQTGSTTSGQINYRPILTDFHPEITGAPVNFTPLQYTPQVWRWVDLLGGVPLNKIDIQLFWVDYADVFHPIYLAPGDVATVKLLFRRKGIED